MHESSFGKRPTIVARFRRGGHAGTVRCYHGVTRRASESGFSALRGWERERTAGVAFPTIKCRVESARPGYWSLLGWIQGVTQVFPGRPNPVRIVDRLPVYRRLDLPFATLGYEPAFFDAPAYNSRPAVDWRAALFLCTLPMLGAREAIEPLAGFTWGYRIAHPGADPDPYRLELATSPAWSTLRKLLIERHPKWTFDPRYQRPPLPRSPVSGSRTRGARGARGAS